MSQVCELTGRRPAYGNKVSHSNIKTRTRWMPNLRKKTYEIPELKLSMALMLSTRAIRTIDKHGGITAAIMGAGEKALSERLLKIRHQIYNARVKRTAAGKAAGAPKKATHKAAPKVSIDTPAKAKTKKATKSPKK